ncbi:MAG TPA: sensor histidine kinase, partial [Sphingomicrobium sp.]
DLLTSRNWSGADLSEVVARALDGFNSTRFGVSGSRVELSERQTLAFSMALHELVTNATKYGALSNSAGTVAICWKVEGESLRFRWTESGGPPVSAPGTLGFGSRLLERVVVSDLRGDVEFDYNPAGLRCSINAPMASNNSSRDEAEIGQSPI